MIKNVTYLFLLLAAGVLTFFSVVQVLEASDATQRLNTTTNNTTTTISDTTKSTVSSVTDLSPKSYLVISESSDVLNFKLYADGSNSAKLFVGSSSPYFREIMSFPMIRNENVWTYQMSKKILADGVYLAFASVNYYSSTGTSIGSKTNEITFTIKNIVNTTEQTIEPSLPSEGSGNTTTTQPDATKSTATTPQATTAENKIMSVVSGNTASSVINEVEKTTAIAVDSSIVVKAPENFAGNREEVKSTKILENNLKEKVQISEVKNIEVKSGDEDEQKEQVILFTGKGLPNSIIYLYIFSEPIIVSVKTDENGNWQYVLDRPLSQGKHETYVLIEDPDTQEVLRTEGTEFFVAKALATTNLLDVPGSNGLILEDPFYATFKQYLIYAGAVIGIAFLVLLNFALFKKKKDQNAA